MSTRIDGGARGALIAEDDDWFAPVQPAAVEREEDLPWEDDEFEWDPRDPAPPDLRRRQVALVAAVVVAVFLVVAGVLMGRATKNSTTETVTVTTTSPAAETPAATGSGDGSTATGTTTTGTTTPSTSGTDTTSGSGTETPSSSGTETTPTTTTPSTTTPSSSAVPTGATLRPDDKGASVIALQTALTTLGYATGSADGTYGAKTAEAVKAFQTAKGLTADGIAGAKTLAAINAAMAGGSG